MLIVALVMMAMLTSTASGMEPIRHRALRGHQIWQLSGDGGAVSFELMQKGLMDVLGHSRTSRKVRVPSRALEEARRILQERGVAHEVLVEDLATFLEEKERLARGSVERESCFPNSCPRPFGNSYMTFKQIEWFLQNLCENSTRASLTSLGKSTENRDIWMVHLRSEGPKAGGAIWVEAGIHAREWISSAVALHLLKNLLQDDGTAGHPDVYVVPMANPDGYEYSRTLDRFWRKNRRRASNPECMGVDLNRNWGFHYGVGASDFECSEVFKGAAAFSEPETKALRDAMKKVKDNLKMVLSLHSYGQQLLYPWGYSEEETAPDTDDLIKAGNVFVEAIKNLSNTSYAVANVARDLYKASGTTEDWAKSVLGVKYTYTLELRDEGENGFLLDPSHILPCSEEVWEGLKVLLQRIF
ncbi:carboxypeptidase B-like [Penaeus japonicus]|uniref:carboxypeptidase B-like n=1 Tax=Penaeus japonicus TaxID=27405 RepID=UPI001C70B23D|nr:carboxypeptidase B-like [Penaeus japonicus]